MGCVEQLKDYLMSQAKLQVEYFWSKMFSVLCQVHLSLQISVRINLIHKIGDKCCGNVFVYVDTQSHKLDPLPKNVLFACDVDNGSTTADGCLVHWA